MCECQDIASPSTVVGTVFIGIMCQPGFCTIMPGQTAKTSLIFSRLGSCNKLKNQQPNEFCQQECHLETLRRKHNIRVKILLQHNRREICVKQLYLKIKLKFKNHKCSSQPVQLNGQSIGLAIPGQQFQFPWLATAVSSITAL